MRAVREATSKLNYQGEECHVDDGTKCHNYGGNELEAFRGEREKVESPG